MLYHIPKPFFRPARKTWYVQLHGRQINLGKDKDAAFKRYHEIMAAGLDASDVRSSALTQPADGQKLTDLFDRYLEWLKSNRSPHTYEWYRYRLQRFIDVYPELTLTELKPYHVQEWVDSYPGLAVTTKRNYIRSVKRSLHWAKMLGHIDQNPIEYISAPTGQAKDVYISQQEFDQLLANTPDEELKKLMVVTYETGCRPQESLRLEIRHVELDNRRFVLPRKEAKGKKAPRVIYLTDKAFQIVSELIAGRTSGHVFRDSKNRPWTPAATNSVFKRIRQAMGRKVIKEQKITFTEEEIKLTETTITPTHFVKGREVKRTKAELRTYAKAKLVRAKCKELVPSYSLYALRHSWATNALTAGVDALTVAILMGHQDPSMLAKVYQHLSHSPMHMLEQAKKAVGE